MLWTTKLLFRLLALLGRFLPLGGRENQDSSNYTYPLH